MSDLLYKPKVFISHSAKETEAQELCKAIANGLRGASFGVLWDANLPTAGAWRGAIDEWIWSCDAAVMVLSQDAVQSKYVAYEAAHLRQRWLHMKPRFALIPVWCPGVTNQLLVQSMGALQIAEIHTNVKIAAWPPQGVAQPFDATVTEIVKELKALREQAQPRHDIEQRLVEDFKFGATNESALVNIANAYNLPALPPGALQDRAALLARLLLDSNETLGDQRFQRLKSGIPTMMAALESAKDRVPRIVRLVAPFCWVSTDCVGRIPSLFAQPSAGVRAIAWKRSWEFSERMYLCRAFCTSQLNIVSPSELSGGNQQAAFDHILKCLADKVCNKPSAKVEDVAARITKLTGQGEPVFLILPADVMDDALLAKICKTWDDLRVFLYSEAMDAQELSMQFPNVQIIEPPLASEDEDSARAEWGACMKAAGWTPAQYRNLEVFDA